MTRFNPTTTPHKTAHGAPEWMTLACAITTTLLVGVKTHAAIGDDPFADVVVDFDPGSNGAPGFDNPQTALGSPERFTGEGSFPSVVSPFSPPFGSDEIVSIGTGGHLTVQFNTPLRNDAGNPFGIDLLIFNNTGFIDASFPDGVVGGIFGNDGGQVEVSANGVDWFLIPNALANDMFPTLGYLDSGPYDNVPGSVPSDFTRPVDPSLGFSDFDGRTHAEVVELYNGSGGGVGIDIGLVGLSEVSFVRVSTTGSENIEIDGFADVAVPAPGVFASVAGVLFLSRRRRRSEA